MKCPYCKKEMNVVEELIKILESPVLEDGTQYYHFISDHDKNRILDIIKNIKSQGK